jgi:hypothetical protein
MEIVDVQNIELVIGKGGAARQRQNGRGQQTELKRLRHSVLLVFIGEARTDYRPPNFAVPTALMVSSTISGRKRKTCDSNNAFQGR